MFWKTITALALLAGTATAANAAGDAAKGAQIFKRCAICHNATKGGPNRIGPDLWGIVGHKAAQHPGFSYSPALKKANLTWTPATLDKWLTSPGRLVPGTKMAFAGLSSAGQRADVIAYLETLK